MVIPKYIEKINLNDDIIKNNIYNNYENNKIHYHSSSKYINNRLNEEFNKITSLKSDESDKIFKSIDINNSGTLTVDKCYKYIVCKMTMLP